MPTKRKNADSTSPAHSGDSGRDKLADDKNDRVDDSDSNVVAIDNDAPCKSKSVSHSKMKKTGGIAVASSSSVGVGQKKKRARTSKKSTATTTDDQMVDDNTNTNSMKCTTMNDDITKVKTAKHCAKQWESLFQLRDSRKTSLKGTSSTANTISNNANNSTQDVFNFEDLIIPPSHELVNKEVDIGIQRWKDLAARVIVEEDGPTICKTEDGCTTDNIDGSSKITLKNEELLLDAATSGDKRKHRLLPYNFDYMCKKKNPSNDDRPTTTTGDDNIISGSADDVVVNQYHHRPKVISLVDPTQTLDYESELWNVFNSMKTSTELERIYALGSNTKKKSFDNPEIDDNTRDASVDNEEISHGCKHTLDVKQNLVGWIKKNTRLDAHSLGRLRVRDCHANPVSGGIACPANRDDHSQPNDTDTTLQTTVRFEILRHSQNLKRASGPDGNRMEVELHGSCHTLLDLHRLLVECSLNTSSLKEGEEVDGDVNNNIHPGVFFIENNFYTCGDVGDRIGVAIKNWLSDKKSGAMEKEDLSRHTTPRQQHLGISNKINMIPMSEMKLEDLPLRLGVRYYHMLVPPPTSLHLGPNNVISLANESAVYVTGIHTHKSKKASNNSSTKPSIIIHDTWASSQRHTCLACKYFLASVVTVNDPLTDSSPPSLDPKSNKVLIQGVPLCSSCYRALHYEPANNLDQPQLKLRASSKPSLVFSTGEYQRMVTASSFTIQQK